MMIPGIPLDDDARVSRLQALEVLDTAPEPLLDVFTRMAADIAGHPIALLSLVDHDRQWFKSAVGVSPGGQAPREHSFCGHAILGEDILEVEDARTDERFHDNPEVTGGLRVVHYAGAPLCLPGGIRIGTICLIDHVPRALSALQRTLLAGLAEAVVEALLARERLLLSRREVATREAFLRDTLERLPHGLMVVDQSGKLRLHNSRSQQLLDLPSRLVRGPDANLAAMANYNAERGELGPGDPRVLAARHLAHMMQPGPISGERTRPDGTVLDIQVRPLPGGGHVVVHTDITAHRLLELELRRERARLEQALEATALGLWEFDVSTGMVTLFETWGPLFGYPRGARELPLQSLGDLVPEYAWRLWNQEMQALVTGQSDHLFVEHEMTDGTGHRVWIASEAKVLERDGRGWVCRVIGTSKNVTERRKAPVQQPVASSTTLDPVAPESLRSVDP